MSKLLAPEEAVSVVLEEGYRTTIATLSKLRSVGGGPPYRLIGRYPRYEEDDVRAWVRAKLSTQKFTRAREYSAA